MTLCAACIVIRTLKTCKDYGTACSELRTLNRYLVSREANTVRIFTLYA